MKRQLLFLLCLPLLAVGYPLTPNDKLTPGDYCTDSSSDFFEYRYEEDIPYCKRNVANSLKKQIYEKYKIPEKDRKDYTIDHLIPLSLGGSNQRNNLWPEHKKVKALRPELEMELYVALRDGEITQEEAVDEILEAKFHPVLEIAQ